MAFGCKNKYRHYDKPKQSIDNFLAMRFHNVGGASILCIFISLVALTREVNAQDFNGIALIKPFTHSKESDVSQAIIYDSYTTRPTFFTFEFNGIKQKFDTGLVAKFYNIPNPDKIPNVEQETDVRDIRLSIPRIEYVLNRFKLSEILKSALQNRLDSLHDCIKKFEANQIKKDGVWVDKNKYTAEVEKKKLERQLKEQEENRKLEEIRFRQNEEIRIANEIKAKKRIAVQGKLDSIKLEKIDFMDASINEVIDYLRTKSRQLDASSVESEKGIDIYLANPTNKDIPLLSCTMENASLGEVIIFVFSKQLGLLTEISDRGVIVSMPAAEPVAELSIEPAVEPVVNPEMLRRKKQILSNLDKEARQAEVEISQSLEDGVLGDIYSVEQYTERKTYRSQTLLGPGLARYVNEQQTRRILIAENVFILGITNMADGEKWSGKLWPAGTYTYTNLRNAQRTVRQWATSREEALIKLLMQNNR